MRTLCNQTNRIASILSSTVAASILSCVVVQPAQAFIFGFGGGSYWGDSSSLDVESNFVASSFTSDGTSIAGCVSTSNSCLFRNSVSHLQISRVTFLDTFDELEKIEVGTSRVTLYSQLNPVVDTEGNLSGLPLIFRDELSLKSIWNGSQTLYKIADSEGEPIHIKGSAYNSENGSLVTLFNKPFGFSLTSPERPNDKFINSIEYVAQTAVGDTELPKGYSFENGKGEALSFRKIETKVPESTSTVSFIVFTLLGFRKKGVAGLS